MDDVCWQIERHQATLHWESLLARVDLLRPDCGLGSLAIDNRLVAGSQVLAVEIPEVSPSNSRDVDFYSRGVDLVGTYNATDAWPFRTQIYWRAGVGKRWPGVTTVELVVSVQTNLLDGQPRLTVGSRLAASEVRQLVDPVAGRFQTWQSTGAIDLPQSTAKPCGCTLLRLPESTSSYVEMVHPSDFVHTELTCSKPTDIGNRAEDGPVSLWSLKHALFAAALEKGVILRARVLAAFVDRENDEEQAAAIYREFAASEPPLTT